MGKKVLAKAVKGYLEVISVHFSYFSIQKKEVQYIHIILEVRFGLQFVTTIKKMHRHTALVMAASSKNYHKNFRLHIRHDKSMD